MTVAELDARMTSSELTEWMAYERITGPLGRRRQDIQAATIAATIANASRSKKSKRFNVTDFLIKYNREAKTPQQMLAAVKRINRSLGGEERG